MSDCAALLRLGFPAAPWLDHLTSPDIATRRTVLQKVRRQGYIPEEIFPLDSL